MIIEKMNIECPEINSSLGDPLSLQAFSYNEGGLLLNFNASQDVFEAPQ